MKLNPLAVDNVDLLHEIEAAPDGESVTGLGRKLGRDHSNLAKTLGRLREAGVVDAEALALTDDGRAVTRLIAADGEILADGATLLLRHDQIEPDPHNARSGDVDPFAINALAADILSRSRPGRVGLLHALTVQPPLSAGGPWRLRGGWRRWLAIRNLIDREDLPEDAPIPCVRHEGLSDGEAAIMAIVENVQREDLHPLDEGDAYRRLIREFDLSVEAIAEAVNKSKKHVQDRVALTEKLGDDLKARMRLPDTDETHLSYTDARREMQALNARPRPPVDVTPKEALVLMEVAERVKRQPSHDVMFPAKAGWSRIPALPAGGAASSLVDKGLIELKEPDYGAHAYVRVLPPKLREVEAWIAEQGAMGLWHARGVVLGTGVAAELEQGRRFATPWLNDPTVFDAAPPAPAGAVVGVPPYQSGNVVFVEDPQTPDFQEDDIPPYLQRLAGVDAPSPPPRAGEGDRAAVEGALLAATPTPAPTPTLPAVTPVQSRTLREIIYKIAAQPQATLGGTFTGAPVFEYWKDGDSQALVQLRLIKIAPDAQRKGYLVGLTPLGEAWAATQEPIGVQDFPLIGDGYQTAWLNPPAPTVLESERSPAAEARPEPSPGLFHARPVIDPPCSFTCGNCEGDFEISGEVETDDLPNTDAIDAAVFTPPNAGHAECPSCGAALRILKAEVYLVEWPSQEPS